MRIDLPRCNFKNCRYCFDSNCTKKSEYERCEYQLAKSEAIKEFAEKLKEKVYIPGAHPNYSDEIIIEIDNLVKEMTEGEDV